MADTVTSQTLKDSASTWAVKLTNISDGTGEAGVVKVSANTLVNLTAHVDALSFSVCDVTVSAILFFRYSFCKC